MTIESLQNIMRLAIVSDMMNNKSDGSGDSGVFDIVLYSLLNSVANNTNYTQTSLDNSEVLGDILNNNVTSNINNYKVNQNSTKEVTIESNNSDTNTKINMAVKSAAQKYGIDENLIKAIIKKESSFNPNAVSSAGAKGLMQIMPFNFKSLGITDPFNIEQNIEAGTKLLKQYLDKFDGNVEMGLMAYNAGPGTMRKRGVSAPHELYKMPKETQNYVPKVMSYYRSL